MDVGHCTLYSHNTNDYLLTQETSIFPKVNNPSKFQECLSSLPIILNVNDLHPRGFLMCPQLFPRPSCEIDDLDDHTTMLLTT